ncbi:MULTISPECIES: methyl-accepting chemotaxis protein [Spirulina sp. CCY15215]|uniref:HAMP domain-containing methyl-accepting chemotaxis protein n=1 Tax=Spirulina sp. CCY15215 TaxID=2767591 RepID=UPI00194E960F|nr:methyl-accepting chemotaxis protein [Spirulina major]
MNLKAKIQLFSVIPALLLGILGGLSIGGFALMNQKIRTIYDDRIVPMEQLKLVSDAYAISIVDATNKANAGVMTSQAALQSIEAARSRIEETWQAYLQTQLTPDEAKFAQDVESLFLSSEPELDRLMRILQTGDRNQLIEFNSQIYQSIDPITVKIHALIELQLDAAAIERQMAAQVFAWILRIFIPLLAITMGVMLSPLRRLISKAITSTLEEMVNTVATTSEEIAMVAVKQDTVASQQAAAVQETTTTMSQLEASSQQSSQQVNSVVERAQEVFDLAQQGSETSSRTLQEIYQLQETVVAVATQIEQLTAQSRAIESISKLVNDIAQQTNLLALNASIEAVRAGDQGRGFTVVATEIRKLAEQTQQSTQNINERVKAIQEAVQRTVTIAERITQNVKLGVSLTSETAQTFEGVKQAIGDVVLSSQQIAQSIQQEAFAIAQVVQAMEQINQGAQETAWGIGQTKLVTQKLNETTLSLQALV